MVLYGTVWCCIVLYGIVWYCIVLYGIVWYCIVSSRICIDWYCVTFEHTCSLQQRCHVGYARVKMCLSEAELPHGL